MSNKITRSDQIRLKASSTVDFPADLAANTLLHGEELISLNRVPRKTGKRYSQHQIRRWAHRGKNGVKLETVKLDGREWTSVAAIRRFENKAYQSATNQACRDKSSSTHGTGQKTDSV